MELDISLEKYPQQKVIRVLGKGFNLLAVAAEVQMECKQTIASKESFDMEWNVYLIGANPNDVALLPVSQLTTTSQAYPFHTMSSVQFLEHINPRSAKK